MLQDLAQLTDGESFDVIVVGAGGAGMSAALFAAISGARVLLVEATGFVGGSTAYSAGTTWIPGTAVGAGVNADDTLAAAATFLDRAVAHRSSATLRAALLAHGAQAVAHLEANSHVRLRARPFHPDYLSDLEGASACGRALEPLPFDGRLLGELFAVVRPPIPEFTVLKGMMVDRDDIGHLLSWSRSPDSFKYCARIIWRHVQDRLKHPRGTRLLMGNALVGSLLLSLRERGVRLLLQTQVTGLARGGNAVANAVSDGVDANGVDSITLRQNFQTRTLHARGGVVLASGGFNRHAQRRAERLPGIEPEWCPGAPGHVGAAHELAEAVGAKYGPTGQSDCFWAPVSLRKRADGSTAAFPHFVFDRAKPHTLVVNSRGKRYLNESTSYHLFALAMQTANRFTPCIPSYLVTDAQGLRKYGLGMVRPGGMGLRAALADGYVLSGATPAELAAKLNVPAANLEQTVAVFNTMSASGNDTEFRRGGSAFERTNGDPTWPGANPTMGALNQPPYYAVQLYPGDIGAATGFLTDAQARALDAQGAAIPGLYACGNDMHSVMGGVYPAPGVTLGPGLVFAFLAAQHAVQRARGMPAAAAPATPQSDAPPTDVPKAA